MIPENRVPHHPGQILELDFLEPHGISAAQLAERIGVPLADVSELLAGRQPVTAPLAWRLAQVFRTTPELWMNLQVRHDLARDRPEDEVEALVPLV